MLYVVTGELTPEANNLYKGRISALGNVLGFLIRNNSSKDITKKATILILNIRIVEISPIILSINETSLLHAYVQLLQQVHP